MAWLNSTGIKNGCICKIQYDSLLWDIIIYQSYNIVIIKQINLFRNGDNMNKKFLLVLILAVILLLGVSMLFSGCGRRARIVQAIKERGSENAEEESIDEDADAEEVSGNGDIDEDADMEDKDTDTQEDIDDNEDVDMQEDINGDEDAEEVIVDEEEIEQPDDAGQFTDEVPFAGSESGNIIGGIAYTDPVLYPGDNGNDNLEVRGFISFDISGLTGATVIESHISATADSIFGKPFDTYGPLIIKAVYWGPRAISPDDYDLDGVELRNITKKNFGIQNRNLKEDLQRAIDSGSGRYQLIFYFEMNGTDGDDQADNITYYLEDIIFNITYIQ